MTRSRPFLAAIAALLLASSSAGAQQAEPLAGTGENIQPIARVKVPGANEVELAGDWAFVATDEVEEAGGGLTIVNIADPTHPYVQSVWDSRKVEIPDFSAGDVDLSADGNLAVLSNAHGSATDEAGAWVALIDVRDKSHPKLVGQIKNDSDVTYVHTSTLDGTTLFTNPSTWLGSPQPGASHVTVFDVSDPANPVKKAKIASPTSEAGFAHDITLDHRPDGKTLMYAASVHFSDVFDATNPLAPTHLQTIATTDGNVSHDVQPNFDRTMLILTDENLAGQVEPSAAACGKAGSGPASVDVGSVHFHAANPDGTFANEGLTRLGTFYGPPMLAAGYCIAHVIWQAPSENKLTQAYYDAGAWIIDFDDPADAKALGWFKAEEGGTYWANKPHNGYLYASGYGGATGSLDVLRYTGAGWPATAGPAEVQRAARHGVPYVPLAGASAPPAPPKASIERAIGRFAFTARARRVPGRKRARTTLTVTFVKGGKVVGRVRTKRAAGRTTTVKVRGVAEAGVYRWTLKARRKVLARGTLKVVKKAGLSLSPGATVAARIVK